jgi:hypothetical protein
MARSNKFETSFNAAINEPSSRRGATKQANIADQSKRCATAKCGTSFGMSYVRVAFAFILLSVFLCPCRLSANSSTSVTVAFAELPSDGQFIYGVGAFYDLMRILTAQPVPRALKRIVRANDPLNWRVTLKKDLKFINGAKITNRDLISSIKICEIKSLLPKIITIEEQKNSPATELFPAAVLIKLEDKQAAKLLDKQLERCPLLEERSSRIFADKNGTNGLFISYASHQIVSIKHERELNLIQRQELIGGDKQLRNFKIVTYLKENDAISGVRSGKLDVAFINDESEDLQAIREDEQLQIEACSDLKSWMIKRSDIKLSCRNGISFL